MAQNRPSQKSVFIQQMLLAIVVFLGVQMFCGRTQGPTITDVSATTPAVVHFSVDHQQRTGSGLVFKGIGGVPPGEYYIKELDSTHVALYKDKQLADPVSNTVTKLDNPSWAPAADTTLGDVAQAATEGPPPVPQVQGAEVNLTLASMMWNATKLNWSTLSQQNKGYQDELSAEASLQLDAIQAQVKAGKGTQADVDQAKKDSDAKVQEGKLYGDILLAVTQFNYGVAHNDTGQVRNAFNTLQSWERSLQGKDLWTKQFTIPTAESAPWRFTWTYGGATGTEGKLVSSSEMTPDVLAAGNWTVDTPGMYRVLNAVPVGEFKPSTISGKDLLDKIVTDLSARNRTELTYGIFPGYTIIDTLVHLTGANPGFSYAFAAFLLALLVRLAVYPLVQKQLMWGRKMQQLAPLIKEIKSQYTDKNGKVTNPAELQQKTMALYAEYGMNPLAGCLPAGVQFPLFITVYQFMLHYQFAFKKGTFLWINAASSAASHGFLAPDLGSRDYILIVIYGISMITSTLLMPVSDPTQIKQQRMMGVGMGLVFTFFMFTGAFPTPAAFVLYWVFTNLIATAQSLRAYRLPLPPLEKVNTPKGGIFTMPPRDDFRGGGGGSAKPNGKPKSPLGTPTSTGKPVKHTPKKRK